jgi:LacI family transcriptional regulator
MKSNGIKDIAKSLGISRGTVDRALHGRPGISEPTRKRVLARAEQIGYRPNQAARSLKLGRNLRIGVFFPCQIASFFDLLRAGVRAAASSAGVNIELVFRTFPRIDEGDVDLLNAESPQSFDGILITPGTPGRIQPALQRFVCNGVPFVCIANDTLNEDRLACVTSDPHSGGAIAVELFSGFIQRRGTIAAVTGSLTVPDHAGKIAGFASGLASYAPHLTFLPPILSHYRPRDTAIEMKRLFARKPHPLGIYVSIANTMPVLHSLEKRNLLGKVPVIATDLLPEIIPFIESGAVLAALSQRPFTQGKLALELIVRYLTEGVLEKPLTILAPHIIMRSNLALFRSQSD